MRHIPRHDELLALTDEELCNDCSGWWLLIALVPLIGAIVLLVFLVLDSNSGQNQYGANRKDVIA